MRYKTLNTLLIIFLIWPSCFGQKIFFVSIHFPKEFTNQNVDLSYDNGRTVKKVPFLLHHDAINVSGSFYFKFAKIEIRIDSNKLNLPAFSSFFVGTKPASITFTVKKNTGSHPKFFTLVNAYDIGTLTRELEKYTAPERQAFEDFQSDTTVNDSSFIFNQMLVRKWVNKKLEFIRLHKDEYYSFRLFRTDIAPIFFMDADSLLHFYKTNFPDNLRNTPEGKEIMEILHGRKIASSENKKAPNFKIMDIHGNWIELKNYKGKYVLINFWASWCVPCVAELPSIKKISDQFFPKNLIIITNTIDRDTLAFLAAIKKYGMSDWINTYNSADLEKKFGGIAAIPQLFLIDPKGKIIYNRNFNPIDNDKLTRLNQIVKEKLLSCHTLIDG